MRRILAALTGLALLGAPSPMASPVEAAGSPFTDIADSLFRADIEWLYAEGITTGAARPPVLPRRPGPRDQMASFLARMFHLPPTDKDFFTDDRATSTRLNINRLRGLGRHERLQPDDVLSQGRCPARPVASFLARAVPLTAGAGRNYFRDDNGTLHEANIDRLAAAGIANGLRGLALLPQLEFTRGQMAAFLHRVVRPWRAPCRTPHRGSRPSTSRHRIRCRQRLPRRGAPCRTSPTPDPDPRRRHDQHRPRHLRRGGPHPLQRT